MKNPVRILFRHSREDGNPGEWGVTGLRLSPERRRLGSLCPRENSNDPDKPIFEKGDKAWEMVFSGRAI